MEVQFAGPEWAGSIEFAPDGVTVFAAPSDAEDAPHMSVVTLDPTPDQARAVARAFAEWADMVESRTRPNAQPNLLGLLP